ncbi:MULTISPECIES: cell division protein ZapA [unclassified Halanaerobium]|uniref:cell division protein ZapA n=1 Tax=unclassified Halanaerobium TaxID=2641197 RepID=UPI000DF23341|nr:MULTISPECIES: cell division protein ZapA [unclassified Halanaerobium]RCW50489.1 cell division protein ZapA [Halanaerobium sp. MA284_MarDTE_T2]RCW85976.1 cell division protein ZapA [Halanaerobium sp. DL-01]
MTAEKNFQQNKNKIKVKILGDTFTVIGEFDENYIKKLAEYVEKVSRDIRNTYPELPYRRLANLTMINLADEYFKLRSDCIDLSREKERLREANQSLHDELKKLRQENKELMTLLEEVE